MIKRSVSERRVTCESESKNELREVTQGSESVIGKVMVVIEMGTTNMSIR